jgi:C-terminal processing protease CtpA/Prc
MKQACLLLLAGVALASPKKDCTKDVNAAIKELKKQCGELIRVKKINWNKVGAAAKKQTKKVKTDQEHYEVLVRLIAALRDGHAYVKAENGAQYRWPGPDLKSGPGLYFCRSGKSILVKNAWGPAQERGVRAGDEVVRIDGMPAARWIEERVELVSEFASFSTVQQAFFFTCHWGLCGPDGSDLQLAVKSPGKQPRKVKVQRGKASGVPYGPVFAPKGVQRIGRQQYGKTEKGFGYIHLRDTKKELPGQLDTMLAALGNVPGLILDFRANGGGGFDHDGVLARFVPTGKKLKRAKAYAIPSQGENPYGGPIVVIVDAGARSAGETGSGMFKEDGRAYMIGESATAGMSSSKVTIPLPSGKFSLYVSVRSNKARFQGGRGIEGIGIEPHEVVEYKAEDLAAGKDTLILRAEELLADFPQGKVPYRPKQYGWTPPK